MFTDRKIFAVATPKKTTERRTACTCSNQEERRRDKTPAYTIDIQSLMASDGDLRQWLTVHQFDTCRSQSRDHIVEANEAYYRKVMLLSQFLHAIRQILRVLRLSAGQCPGAHGAYAVNFLTRNFARCWRSLKILSKQTR